MVSKEEARRLDNLDRETLEKYGLKLCPTCEDAVLETVRKPRGLFGSWEYYCPNCEEYMLI